MASDEQDFGPVIIAPWCFTCRSVILYGKIDYTHGIKFIEIKVRRFSCISHVRIPQI